MRSSKLSFIVQFAMTFNSEEMSSHLKFANLHRFGSDLPESVHHPEAWLLFHLLL